MTDCNRIIQEAYRLSELRLQSQFTAALAADQRATGIAGLTSAAAAVLVGLSANALVPAAMLVGAALLVVAALLAWYSARPQAFYAPGAEFADLQDDIAQGRSMDEVLAELGGFNDKHTIHNDGEMKRASRLVHWAFRISALGLAVALLPQLLTLVLALAGTN